MIGVPSTGKTELTIQQCVRILAKGTWKLRVGSVRRQYGVLPKALLKCASIMDEATLVLDFTQCDVSSGQQVELTIKQPLAGLSVTYSRTKGAKNHRKTPKPVITLRGVIPVSYKGKDGRRHGVTRERAIAVLQCVKAGEKLSSLAKKSRTPAKACRKAA
jgi:hypothetical protein